MFEKSLIITNEQIDRYANYLLEQERADSTVRKYIHDLGTLAEFLCGNPVTKSALLAWKEMLIGRYAPASVNVMIAAVNQFLAFCGRTDIRLRPLRLQKSLYLREDKELTRAEYIRLVQTAESEGNHRLALVIQTICATGIRVSELCYVTVEAVQSGRADVANKGKRRTIFLPDKLRNALKAYLKKKKITAGTVFLSRNGRPLNRSNIWRDMKRLCARAGVTPAKVFPHNLRHLFARVYYTLEKDLSRLADILGHSSVNTTRIYTAESGAVHIRQLGRLGLVVT